MSITYASDRFYTQVSKHFVDSMIKESKSKICTNIEYYDKLRGMDNKSILTELTKYLKYDNNVMLHILQSDLKQSKIALFDNFDRQELEHNIVKNLSNPVSLEVIKLIICEYKRRADMIKVFNDAINVVLGQQNKKQIISILVIYISYMQNKDIACSVEYIVQNKDIIDKIINTFDATKFLNNFILSADKNKIKIIEDDKLNSVIDYIKDDKIELVKRKIQDCIKECTYHKLSIFKGLSSLYVVRNSYDNKIRNGCIILHFGDTRLSYARLYKRNNNDRMFDGNVYVDSERSPICAVMHHESSHACRNMCGIYTGNDEIDESVSRKINVLLGTKDFDYTIFSNLEELGNIMGVNIVLQKDRNLEYNLSLLSENTYNIYWYNKIRVSHIMLNSNDKLCSIETINKLTNHMMIDSFKELQTYATFSH